jgi:predicted MFS family arabinose efflux permease
MVTFLQVGLATGGTVGGLAVDMSGVSAAFTVGAALSLIASGIFAMAFVVFSDEKTSAA